MKQICLQLFFPIRILYFVSKVSVSVDISVDLPSSMLCFHQSHWSPKSTSFIVLSLCLIKMTNKKGFISRLQISFIHKHTHTHMHTQRLTHSNIKRWFQNSILHFLSYTTPKTFSKEKPINSLSISYYCLKNPGYLLFKSFDLDYASLKQTTCWHYLLLRL